MEKNQWYDVVVTLGRHVVQAVEAYFIAILIWAAVVLIFTAKPMYDAIVTNAENKRKHNLELRKYDDKLKADAERRARKQRP